MRRFAAFLTTATRASKATRMGVWAVPRRSSRRRSAPQMPSSRRCRTATAADVHDCPYAFFTIPRRSAARLRSTIDADRAPIRSVRRVLLLWSVKSTRRCGSISHALVGHLVRQARDTRVAGLTERDRFSGGRAAVSATQGRLGGEGRGCGLPSRPLCYLTRCRRASWTRLVSG